MFQAASKERAIEFLVANKKSNRISALKDAGGNIITDQNGLEEIAVNFYKDLFSA